MGFEDEKEKNQIGSKSFPATSNFSVDNGGKLVIELVLRFVLWKIVHAAQCPSPISEERSQDIDFRILW